MVLFFYGLNVSHAGSTPPTAITSGIKKTSIGHLTSLFRSYGLKARAFWLYDHELKKLELPLIILFGRKHYAVLVGIGDGFFVVKDPGRGHLRLSKTAFKRLFGNVALEITLTVDNTPSTQPIYPRQTCENSKSSNPI
jgi:ABC-type bacteriocin/lantibiotic exporter with double-glycine peptidase domain